MSDKNVKKKIFFVWQMFCEKNRVPESNEFIIIETYSSLPETTN